MEIKAFCNKITELYLYADTLKFIHFSTKKHWLHKYCDEFQDTIRDFIDELSEQFFGFYGRPSFDDFSLDQDVELEEDAAKIMGKLMDIANEIQDEVKDIKNLSGMVSLIDDFKGNVNKMIYLAKFDDISNYSPEKGNSDRED